MKIKKKNLILYFFYTMLSIILCVNTFHSKVYASSHNEQTQQIIKIEKNIWGFEYKKDDISKRLTRIEKEVFGTTNVSLSTDERIKKINETIGLESLEDSKKQGYEIVNNEVNGINYPRIDKLELQLFKTTYEKENIYSRLDRLENKLFGSTQDGTLASRTDKLNSYLTPEPKKQDPKYHIEQPYTTTSDIEPYMGSQNKYENSDIYIQIAGLEGAMFRKTFSQDPVELRLNRLERKIFQRDFSSDDEFLRLQRLQAAANAQKTAGLYEANKVQKYTSTGMQLGSILLMILALIL